MIEDTRIEKEFYRSQEEWEAIFAAIGDIVTIQDTNHRIVWSNFKACEMFGLQREGLVGRFCYELFQSGTHPCEGCPSVLAIKDLEVHTKEIVCKKLGKIFSVSSSPVYGPDTEILNIIYIARDITEKKMLEGQLRQAQKMEAIGQLAAGLAHEINTPMQYVQNNVTFFERAFKRLSLAMTDYQRLQQNPQLSLKEESREQLKELPLDLLMKQIPEALIDTQDGINRVITIVSAMKDFSRPDTGEKTAADLNRAIENTVTVCTKEWKYVAEMVTDLDPALPEAPCFPDQLKQVLLNMIVNAAQAIEETGASVPANPGRITISTSQDGNWVEIRISDTGGGIPEKIREKVFEYFFTTKEFGKGTGQGLAIAHDVIVNKHGGTIDFISEPGKGTTFIIRLPLAPQAYGEKGE